MGLEISIGVLRLCISSLALRRFWDDTLSVFLVSFRNCFPLLKKDGTRSEASEEYRRTDTSSIQDQSLAFLGRPVDPTLFNISHTFKPSVSLVSSSHTIVPVDFRVRICSGCSVPQSNSSPFKNFVRLEWNASLTKGFSLAVRRCSPPQNQIAISG
jgi:hypothetical protein